MRSLSVRALGRRNIAILATALLAFGALAVYRTQASANAHATNPTMRVSCSPGQGPGPDRISYQADHSVPIARPGQQFMLSVTPAMTVPAQWATAPLTRMTINFQQPSDAEISDVWVISSNVRKTKFTKIPALYQFQVEMQANPGVTFSTVRMPILVVFVTPKPGSGTRVVFDGPRFFTLTSNTWESRCTPLAGNPPLHDVTVAV